MAQVHQGIRQVGQGIVGQIEGAQRGEAREKIGMLCLEAGSGQVEPDHMAEIGLQRRQSVR